MRRRGGEGRRRRGSALRRTRCSRCWTASSRSRRTASFQSMMSWRRNILPPLPTSYPALLPYPPEPPAPPPRGQKAPPCLPPPLALSPPPRHLPPPWTGLPQVISPHSPLSQLLPQMAPALEDPLSHPGRSRGVLLLSLWMLQVGFLSLST